MAMVLLVDDDEMIRELISLTLGAEGYRLHEAIDGTAALEVARREVPDLMLLDISMPGIDGFEVCQTLKDDPVTRGIHIVMLTARSSTEDHKRAMAAGADAYVIKPFSPLALRQLVDKILDAR